METLDRMLSPQNVLVGFAIWLGAVVVWHLLVLILDHYTRDVTGF